MTTNSIEDRPKKEICKLGDKENDRG